MPLLLNLSCYKYNTITQTDIKTSRLVTRKYFKTNINPKVNRTSVNNDEQGREHFSPTTTNQDTHRNHTRQNQPTTTTAKTEIVHTQLENGEKTTSNRLAVSPGFHYLPHPRFPPDFSPQLSPSSSRTNMQKTYKVQTSEGKKKSQEYSQTWAHKSASYNEETREQR